MKVALCLSGQPRNVEQGHTYIKKNVLDVCNPDVFIHYWHDKEQTGKPFINAGGHEASATVPENIHNLIHTLYQPRELLAEPQIQFDEKNYNTRKLPGIKPFNSISQRYSVLQAMKLCLETDQYDAVIRMRFDWAISTPLDLNTLDITSLRYPGDCPHKDGINDQFAVGTQYHMEIYSNLYYRLDEYFNQDGVVFCDEMLLKHHLVVNRVPHSPMKIGYGLIRATTMDPGRAI